MKKRKFNIALIGCGRIGFLLENDPLRYKPCTHFGGASTAGLAITHSCDSNPERLALFGEKARLPEKNRYDNYRDLLTDVRPDMVIIATWTESHERIALEAARCGASLIVIEKPMASTIAGCRAVIRECRRRNTAVIVNHERRFDNRYRKVKEMIERGRIGRIRTVHASILTGGHTGPSVPDDGGGPLLHDGTHLVDMVRFLFGDIVSVEGEFQRAGRSTGFEDRACAWLKTERGVDVFLEAGGGRNYFVFELEISGTLGKIVIGNGYESLHINRTSRLYSGFRDIAETAFPAYRKNNCFRELYREAKSTLERGSMPAVSTASDGCRALEAIHAIYLSSHLNRKIIKLPPGPREVDLKKIFNIK
jgi:predicted dehydrogenase